MTRLKKDIKIGDVFIQGGISDLYELETPNVLTIAKPISNKHLAEVSLYINIEVIKKPITEKSNHFHKTHEIVYDLISEVNVIETHCQKDDGYDFGYDVGNWSYYGLPTEEDLEYVISVETAEKELNYIYELDNEPYLRYFHFQSALNSLYTIAENMGMTLNERQIKILNYLAVKGNDYSINYLNNLQNHFRQRKKDELLNFNLK